MATGHSRNFWILTFIVSPIPLNTSFIAHIPREHPCVVKSTRERTDERSEVSFLSRIFRHTTSSTYKVKVCWRRVTGRETPRRPSLRVNVSDTPLRSEKWLCFEPKHSHAVRFPAWKLKMSPPFRTCAFSPRDSVIRAFQCSDCNCYSRDGTQECRTLTFSYNYSVIRAFQCSDYNSDSNVIVGTQDFDIFLKSKIKVRIFFFNQLISQTLNKLF